MKTQISAIIAAILLWIAVPTYASQLTVANGTQQNMAIPMSTYTCPAHSQMVYPASMLTSLVGQYITELRFYTAASTFAWTATFTVRLGEAPYSTFSSNSLMSTPELTEVLVGSFEAVAGGYALQLDQPYYYDGGDLLVDISIDGNSTSSYYMTYYGITRSNASCIFVDSYTPYTDRHNFLPKLTFTYGSTVCGRPTGVAVDSVDGSSARIRWHSAENSTGYIPMLDGAGYPLTTDTTFLFTGLVSNHFYTVSVGSVCSSGDTMVSQSVDVRTDDTTTALWLPYSCDFEVAQAHGLPTWWSRTDSCTVSTGVRPAIVEGNNSYLYGGVHGGARVLQFGGGCGPTGIVSAPLPAGSRELHVSFWYMSPSGIQDPLQVGLLDTAGEFHVVRQYTAGSDYVWYQADFYTDTIDIAGPVRLAFRYTPNYIFLIDDLTIERIAYCPRPVAVVADSVSASSATVRLTPADSGAMMLLSLNGAPCLTTSDTLVTLSGLVPSQHYTLAVRTLCPSGDTSQALVAGFRTECDSMLRLPWSETFDDLAIGTPHPCLTVTARAPRSSYDPVNNPTVSGPGGYGTDTHSGSAMLQMHYTDQQMLYIATPRIATPSDALHISFWYLPYGYYNAGHVQAGFQTTPDDTASFVPFYTSARLNSSGDFVWTHVDIMTDTFATPLPDTVCFVIRAKSGNLYFDDIEIASTFNCPQPIAPHMRQVASTSADLAWSTVSDSGLYQVLLDGTTVATAVADSHYLFTGLMPQQGYTAGVRAVCSDGTLGELRQVVFTTPCVAAALPLVEDFETVGDGETMPTCWMTPMSNSSYPRVQNYGTAHSGSAALNLWGFSDDTLLALTPRFAFPASGLYVGFWERHSFRDSTLVVGIMTDISDLTTLVPLLVFNGTGENNYTWSHHEAYLDSLPGADTVSLAFFTTHGASFYIDDIEISAIATCHRPSHPEVVTVGYDSVSLRWTGSGADRYEVRYSTMSDSSNATATVVDDTVVTLHNLTPGTPHHAWVRGLCGIADSSEWVRIDTFVTDCAPAPLPYSETFTGYYTNADATCWRHAQGWIDSIATAGHSLGYGYSMWSVYNIYGSLFAMRVPLAYYGEHEWLVTPLVEVGDPAQLSFDIRLTYGMGENRPDSLSDRNRLSVAYSHDNGASWQLLGGWGGASGGNLMEAMDSLGWHPLLALPDSLTGNIRFGFCVENGQGGDNVYLHLDNILVEVDSTRIPHTPDTVRMYTVRLTCDSTMGTVGGEGSYREGDTVDIVAQPYDGFRFVQWSDRDTHAVRQIVVSSDTLLTAYFEATGTEGIDDLDADAPRVTLAGHTLVVSRTAGEPVLVYSVEGRVVARGGDGGDGEVRIDAGALGSGVYLVKVGPWPACKVVLLK